MSKVSMEKLINLAKQYGFVFQGSEIYGGLANTWDYGPLGVELKNNIKKAWWKKFIQEAENVVGNDPAILMNSKVWEASGHVGGFNDPLVDCKECKTRHRADKLIEDSTGVIADGWENEKISQYLIDNNIVCPNCSKLNYTEIRQFDMMFKTHQGVIEDSKNEVYLRPETAQGIFVNFSNIQRSMRLKVPFGVGQVGKSFRNEITPGNFIFRTREFEQMELEFFCKPGTELDWFAHYKKMVPDWLESLGVNKENLRLRDHTKEELSHYSNATTDVEYQFPFGWGELWGIASRTDFDLKAHMTASGQSLEYLDPETNQKVVPYVVEPAVSVSRIFLTIFCEAYDEEELEDGNTREIMHLHPALAPYKATILPLNKKYHDSKAKEVYSLLAKNFMIGYDETASIGKRYRRQDIIGTPLCITVDDETIKNNTVTIRDRDTMEQVTIPLTEVTDFINKKIAF